MNVRILRVRIAWLLLAALLLPILAACGEAPAGGGAGTETSAAASAAAPAESAAGEAASEAAAASTEASEAAEASTEASEAAETSTAASALASAATSTAAGATTEDTSQFLIFGNAGEPDSLDSMDTTSGQALVVTDQIEERLVNRVEGEVGTEPGLALEWTPNDDSTEWTFTLREGVKFHDGSDFNADAVVFNYLRMFDPENEFGYRADGKTYAAVDDLLGGPIGSEAGAVTSVEKVDDLTVTFTMNRPFPLLPELLSASYFGISCPAAVEEAGATYGTPEGGACGTGPFKFESWTPGQNIVLVRNDEYWGEAALMPGAVVRFIADAPARLAELQAGSIDFAQNLAPDARETLESDPNLKEPEVEPFNTAYVAMNFNTKPFDDLRVRQAIAYAINKQEILDAFYGGVGEVATDFLPSGLSWARPTTVETYDYNLDTANALLDEAGITDGDGDGIRELDGQPLAIEFWYMPVSRPYFPTPQPVAEAIAAQLSDIGINVSLQTEDWGVYLDNVDQGKKQGMWMLGWTGDYADPNNFLLTFFGPTAETEQGYKNQELLDTLYAAQAAASREEAAAAFQEAGAIIAADVARIPIVHAPPVYGAREALQGWVPSPFGHEPWNTISIEK